MKDKATFYLQQNGAWRELGQGYRHQMTYLLTHFTGYRIALFGFAREGAAEAPRLKTSYTKRRSRLVISNMKGLLHKGMIVNLFDYWVYGQFDVPINHDHRLSRCQEPCKAGCTALSPQPIGGIG